jgi:signal transduction histidine kinase
MTIRSRLTLTIAAIAALLVTPAIYGINRLSYVTRIAFEQRERHGAGAAAMARLQFSINQLDRAQRAYAVTLEERDRLKMWSSLDSARVALSFLAAAGYQDAARDARRDLDILSATAAQIDTLMHRSIHATTRSDSLFLLQQTSLHVDRIEPIFAEAHSHADRIAARIDALSGTALQEARTISETAVQATLIALLLCVGLAVLLALWTTRAISRPIVRLEAGMATVAAGQFQLPDDLPQDRRDEIGSLARSFRAMTRRLAELDRMKAEFMSIATHELKTPINVISGYAELMQERVYGDVNDRQDDALSSVRDQARILATLVNQLLDISRLEAGGLQMQFLDVVLSDLFERIGRSFGPLAQKKRIDFSVQLDPALPETVPGDADRLRDQVLGNILSNALKFTPENGRITVRAWPAACSVVIEVRDTGPGIPPDKLPFVFDKFFQVGEQARSKGAGLGLAIAHDVIEAHSGSIAAESDSSGTTFRIELPAGPRTASVAVEPELAGS